MSDRVVGELEDNLKGKLSIEVWRLETVGRENEVLATTPHGLRLDLSHQMTAKTRPTQGRRDPNET